MFFVVSFLDRNQAFPDYKNINFVWSPNWIFYLLLELESMILIKNLNLFLLLFLFGKNRLRNSFC